MAGCAAGGLPLVGAPPLGAASVVPQSAPHSASAIISFFSVLFMVVFLSSFRASPFSRSHKAREPERHFLTRIFEACPELNASSDA